MTLALIGFPHLSRPSGAGATEVIFTYDIAWEESSVLWSNRWDVYLKARARPRDVSSQRRRVVRRTSAASVGFERVFEQF